MINQDPLIAVTLPYSAWTRTLWAIGKQPHELVDEIIINMRMQIAQALQPPPPPEPEAKPEPPAEASPEPEPPPARKPKPNGDASHAG